MNDKPTYEELNQENKKLKQQIITLKESEKALKESEFKFSNIIEHSTGVFYSHTPDHILTYLSPQIEEVLGYTQEEALINWTKLASDNPINIKGFQKTVIAIETGKQQAPYELEFICKNGKLIIVEVREKPILENGKTVGIVGLFTDITDRKLTELKIKEKNEEIVVQNESYEALNKELRLTNSEITIIKEKTEESKRILDTLIGNLPGMVYRCKNDANWTMEYVSMGVKELCGYLPDDVINNKNLSWGSIIHPDDNQSVLDDVLHSSIDKNQFTLKYRIFDANGNLKWVWEQGRGIYYNNELIALEGYIVDVTKQHQTEEKLIKAKENAEESEKNLLINQAKLKKALMVAKKSKELETANKKLLENEKVLRELNEELQTSEEELRQINEELKSSQEYIENQYSQIENHKNKLRAILDNSNAIIYVKDLQGKYLTINKIYEKLFNISEQNIIGKTDFDLFPENIAKELAKNDKLIIKEKKSLKFEEEVSHNDGIHIYLSLKFLIYNEKNKAYAVGGISTDISGRKKAEIALKQKGKELEFLNLELMKLNTEYQKQNKELLITKEIAESANNAKSRFLANMSHEIRTPMNAILGFSEILKKKIKNPAFEQYLSAISSSGKSLHVLINDILDLSKIEAAKINIVYSAVDFNKFINEINLIFAKNIDEKGLDFIKEIDSEIPDYILIDEIRVKQIISNLLSNAVKFTISGYIKLKVELVKKSDGLCCFKFIVKDTGIGIPKDQHEIIFEAFRQQKDQTFGNYGGTGLGLSICKGLAEQMDGTIDLKSEIDKGSEFTFILKNVEITNVSKLKTSLGHFADKKIVFEKATILIAEDIKLNRDLLTSFIEDYDFEIIEAENGKTAVELAIKHKPQLILMDIRMPVLNGIDATKTLKSDKRTKHIPIVAVTASTTGKDKELVIKVCDDSLFKPVSYNKLISTISKYLKHIVIDEKVAPKTNFENKTNKAKNIIKPDELYKLLKENIEPKWKSIKNTLIINEIIGIANYIADNYESYNYDNLIIWANKLKSQAQIFDLDAVEKTINHFPDLLEELLSISKKLKNE